MYEPKLMVGRGAARAQRPPGREKRSMRRIGILSFSSPGHFYPLTALGRRLQARGHEVVYFQVADLERPIRAAELIEEAFGTGWRAVPSEVGRHAANGIEDH